MSVATLRFGSWGFVLVTGLLLATAVLSAQTGTANGECVAPEGSWTVV